MQASRVIKMVFRLTRKTNGHVRCQTRHAAGTTRGFGTEEFRQVGHLIGDVLDGLASNRNDNSDIEAKVRGRVRELCRAFPIYQ
ncbi:MAG: hypothetical protein CM15mP100_5580 [Alphaproteobacteria bacterium]|nr:MAG: hypothetical protein CM15mP100_5580 [Alphaproteobacteria bacterium]